MEMWAEGIHTHICNWCTCTQSPPPPTHTHQYNRIIHINTQSTIVNHNSWALHSGERYHTYIRHQSCKAPSTKPVFVKIYASQSQSKSNQCLCAQQWNKLQQNWAGWLNNFKCILRLLQCKHPPDIYYRKGIYQWKLKQAHYKYSKWITYPVSSLCIDPNNTILHTTGNEASLYQKTGSVSVKSSCHNLLCGCANFKE